MFQCCSEAHAALTRKSRWRTPAARATGGPKALQHLMADMRTACAPPPISIERFVGTRQRGTSLSHGWPLRPPGDGVPHRQNTVGAIQKVSFNISPRI